MNKNSSKFNGDFEKKHSSSSHNEHFGEKILNSKFNVIICAATILGEFVCILVTLPSKTQKISTIKSELLNFINGVDESDFNFKFKDINIVGFSGVSVRKLNQKNIYDIFGIDEKNSVWRYSYEIPSQTYEENKTYLSGLNGNLKNFSQLYEGDLNFALNLIKNGTPFEIAVSNENSNEVAFSNQNLDFCHLGLVENKNGEIENLIYDLKDSSGKAESITFNLKNQSKSEVEGKGVTYQIDA